MPLPSKRNPEELARTLETWFSKQFGHACTITDVGIPEGTGMSSETLLFTLHHNGLVEPVVTRLNPDMNDWPVFPIYDMAAQAGAMQLVGNNSDLPVPNIRFLETDTSILGSPFLVMDRVTGRALPDMPPYVFGGSYMDAMSVDERRELGREVARVQARIHAIDLSTANCKSLEYSLDTEYKASSFGFS
jgi:aminoglycoside phosphotransferase (APT) family kinase protein